MLATSEDSIIGRVVGPYRVLDRLDGDPSLYIAEHVPLDRRVALRLIPPDAAKASASLELLFAEARKLSRITQENVLGLVDLGETGDGHVYLALELPVGTTLERVLAKQGPISAARARIIGRQIGAALTAAARASLRHCDIAPRNIFLSKQDKNDDQVKIDFAGADMRAAEPVGAPDGVQTLGGLLYQMVVGQLPVAGASNAPLDPPLDPILARPDLEIPMDLDVLIMRALDPDPAKRWPDIDTMLRALASEEKRAAAPEAAAEHVGAHTDSGTGTAFRVFGRTLFRRPARRALVAGGVAGAVALILGILLVNARREGPLHEATVGPAVPARDQPVPGPAASTGASDAALVAVAIPVSPLEANPSSGGLGQTAPAIAAPPLPAHAATEGGGPKHEAGVPLENKHGAPGPGGVAAAPSPDDQQKMAIAPRPGGGDDACAVTLGSKPWAEVWIDGRQAGFTPLVDYPIDCGPHDVVFKSSGSDIEKRISIAVAPGLPFKKIVDLTGKDTQPAGTTTTATMAIAATTGTFEPAAATGGTGCLVTLGSKPWSEIWIDGKRAGATPLVEYGLSCGKHDVIFRGTDPDVERHETIVVQRGRTLKKVVALVQDPAP